MSTNKILLKFAKKGINLSPEAYERVINADNPTDFASNLIVKLKSDKFTSKDLVSVSGDTVDELTGNKSAPQNDNQDTLVKPSEPEIKRKTQKSTDKAPQPQKIKTQKGIDKKTPQTPKSIDNNAARTKADKQTAQTKNNTNKY